MPKPLFWWELVIGASFFSLLSDGDMDDSAGTFFWREVCIFWAFGEMDVQEEFGWDVFAPPGIEFGASVAQSSLEACQEGLCGLVGATVSSSRKNAVM